MKKAIIAMIIGSLYFSISCNIENVHTDLEFKDFVYPLEDGA